MHLINSVVLVNFTDLINKFKLNQVYPHLGQLPRLKINHFTSDYPLGLQVNEISSNSVSEFNSDGQHS